MPKKLGPHDKKVEELDERTEVIGALLWMAFARGVHRKDASKTLVCAEL